MQRSPVTYFQRSAGFWIREVTSTLEKTPDEKRNRSQRDEIGTVPHREKQAWRQPWKKHQTFAPDMERPVKKTLTSVQQMTLTKV